MQWDIAKNIRCDIFWYSKPNFSGYEKRVRIWPTGGRQGDEVDGLAFGSIAINSTPGVRVTLITAEDPQTWEEHPWRCIRVMDGHLVTTGEGYTGVRVPDLDKLDPVDARRTDPDYFESFPIVKRFEDGDTWTFGRAGLIKDNVRIVRVDWVK